MANSNVDCNSNMDDSFCKYLTTNFNLTDFDPASQYIKQKIIQNTVRVPASLYISDLAALSVYQTPGIYKVNWNQMSDRRERHIQPNMVTGGSTYHGSSTKKTVTRARPGAGCPGGAGVDIKHNSYERYLLRLKGKGPARRGIVPPYFGQPIPFNPALPVYGGKTMKTNIVGDNCTCPIHSKNTQTYNITSKPITFDNFDIEKCYIY